VKFQAILPDHDLLDELHEEVPPAVELIEAAPEELRVARACLRKIGTSNGACAAIMAYQPAGAL
jgi:hypothetical protein